MTAQAGFDIAKDFHWLAVTDDRGRLLCSHRVDNDPEAVIGAIAELRAIEAEHGSVTVGVDILGGIAALLVAMLLAEGLSCVHVPGLAVNRARRATRGGENKSDPRDAKVIAEQVMLRDDLRVVELPEETAVELRLLVSHRTTLVREATARTARLRDLLTGIHPGLEKATDPTNKSGLILLGHYVTPAEIRRAGPTRIVNYLRKRGVTTPSRRPWPKQHTPRRAPSTSSSQVNAARPSSSGNSPANCWPAKPG
ncbi:IS110 family transposase [Streptomyces coerulescens]|uniref:IS110 family transposase n=1 Tax=Streptomyces coerulescens TaxID=29304 RepID=A0ABW0CWQ2_STRCD